MRYFKTRYLHKIYRGSCVNKRQDVQKVVRLLPRRAANHTFVIEMSKRSEEGKNHAYKVSAKKILRALKWLIENNKDYECVQIDHEELEKIEKIEYIHELEGVEIVHIDELD